MYRLWNMIYFWFRKIYPKLIMLRMIGLLILWTIVKSDYFIFGQK
jgi:hypothetical protein